MVNFILMFQLVKVWTDLVEFSSRRINWVRKKLFLVRVLRCWNLEVMAGPWLEVFKVRLDGALSNLTLCFWWRIKKGDFFPFCNCCLVWAGGERKGKLQGGERKHDWLLLTLRFCLVHCVHGRGLQEDLGRGRKLHHVCFTECYQTTQPEACQEGTCQVHQADAFLACGLGNVRFRVGLNDSKILFQPKQFFSSLV